MNPSRRRFLFNIGVGAAAVAVSGCALLRIFESTRRKPTQVIIPGTWGYDIDTMRIGGTLEEYAEIVKASGWKMGFDYEKLEFGADKVDMKLRHTNPYERRLIPESGAQLSFLGKQDFDKINLETLMSQDYSNNAIVGNNENDQLEPGMVIGIKTEVSKEGKECKVEKYAKLKIEGWIPKTLAPDNNYPKYNLVGRLVVYKGPKT